jgi:hypothetical protein
MQCTLRAALFLDTSHRIIRAVHAFNDARGSVQVHGILLVAAHSRSLAQTAAAALTCCRWCRRHTRSTLGRTQCF